MTKEKRTTNTGARTATAKRGFDHGAYYARWSVIAALIIFGSLALGVAGYHYTENMVWIDALLNAAMILGGMGPVDILHTDGGKIFASFYALYSCFVVLGLTGIFLVPLMHRVLKRFHSDPQG